jgi:hypothetical protein
MFVVVDDMASQLRFKLENKLGGVAKGLTIAMAAEYHCAVDGLCGCSADEKADRRERVHIANQVTLILWLVYLTGMRKLSLNMTTVSGLAHVLVGQPWTNLPRYFMVGGTAFGDQRCRPGQSRCCHYGRFVGSRRCRFLSQPHFRGASDPIS